MQELNKCPICSGKAVWCDSLPDIDEGKEFHHECSYIRCTGVCVKQSFYAMRGQVLKPLQKRKPIALKFLTKGLDII